MQNTEQLSLTPPALPSGGGTVTGLKGDMAAAGPDGAATLSIPLPISAGRGYAPSLSLSYHSRGGNDVFGAGWSCGQLAIRRQTRKGVPQYDKSDIFTGPDGEVLVPALNTDGISEMRTATRLLGESLGGTYNVTNYRSRVETGFSRFERWVYQADEAVDFWLIYSPDGQIHLLGRNPQARIHSPAGVAQTAVWLMESSVSASGEQIYWQYRQEDDQSCPEEEKTAHPGVMAQRYLVAVWYGNKTASRTLPALLSVPAASDWLFTLVLNYGESTALAKPLVWATPGSSTWPCRLDMFSSWEYGFELRTRRLCQDVLMFHDVAALSGEAAQGDERTLVARLKLDYNASSSLTTLKTAQQAGYEADGTLVSLPPLSFSWQSFSAAAAESVSWQQREDIGRLNPLQPYQMVDLRGEGLAGILYQDAGAWWYREPVRQSGDDKNAVTWAAARPLPAIPSLRDGGTLLDLNGDGYLEWIVTTPGAAGSYAQTPEQSWQHFTPLSALPTEYRHPQMQMTDVTGAGLADMLLIGPKSVRLYSGTGRGWKKARTVMQADGINLPVPGTDARIMVAFSDMAGSGQQHLTEIKATGVRYWPSLGYGHFASPVSVPGFSQPAETFNPQQLFLADIDGSGTTDLIYALSDHLLVWLNQSGNSFAAPFRINLPAGVRYDRTSGLQVADIQGLGVSSLVLSVSHPAPRSWVCHLTEAKPWLLNGMNNNMGASHTLYYRSSAQFWLDEKAAVTADRPAPVCYLPFVLHTLSQTEASDEITGNRLTSTVRYRRGVWDRREREFRGFAFVETSDTEVLKAQNNGDSISAPAISRSWYATGLADADDGLSAEYWRGDSAAFSGYQPRFTRGSGEEENVPESFSDEAHYWLHRGLRGMLLRSELYGADGSSQADIPYSVTEVRPQVRLITEAGSFPVVWPTTAESRTYHYERVSSDPQCSQQILLSSDANGLPLQQVSISYPRRSKPDASPYSADLPEGLFADSFDEQQQKLRLALTQSSWHTLMDISSGVWLPAVTDASRSDLFVLEAAKVPATGITLENLLTATDLLAEPVFAGQVQAWYQATADQASTASPAFPPLPAFTESAVLDEEQVSVLSADIDKITLEKAGYSAVNYLFPRSGEESKKLWAVCQGYTTFSSPEHFYLPVAARQTLLTGETTVSRDTYDCVVLQSKNAAGGTTSAQYDWRFLTPVRITDVNDNRHSVTLDALGRVTSQRFSGTENSAPAGYSDTAFAQPANADEALALSGPLPIAQCMVYVADSWMRTDEEKQPPHVVMLATDRYDSDAAQQIRQQVLFNDGFGRVLQAGSRQADGEAWQRAEDGSLKSENGTPTSATTTFRWAISGRTEYDNKGHPIRTYQPFFLDSWQYLSDDSARQDLYADTHYYDATGRERLVITARGWRRQAVFTPWFVVSEDENDTQT